MLCFELDYRKKHGSYIGLIPQIDSTEFFSSSADNYCQVDSCERNEIIKYKFLKKKENNNYKKGLVDCVCIRCPSTVLKCSVRVRLEINSMYIV